jgi:4-hydroxy-tetrahydrodipicolinate reductase
MANLWRVAVHGAAGKMGKRLVVVGSETEGAQLVGAIDSPNCGVVGQDAGALAGIKPLGIKVSSEIDFECDAVIDFSAPAGAEAITRACVEKKIALVMGTTGLNPEQRAKVFEASKVIPVVFAPSMSTSVNLAMSLVAQAAKVYHQLGASVDVEIIERHHRFKEDSPSGTALKFGELISHEMNLTEQKHGRVGHSGQRPRNEVGYHAVRTGDNPGEHTIIFGLLGETLEINVKASNRDGYAQGAWAAAKFLKGKGAGLYTMKDVLGL